jgi:hypothetical protein
MYAYIVDLNLMKCEQQGYVLLLKKYQKLNARDFTLVC